jgi:methionyl-tRNA formyltransferase
VAQIGVAATAAFGADVLERLAARHEIAFWLTRPDRPAGRGRQLAPPPAKETAQRLDIPVLQPERLDESVEFEVETVVAVAYGLLVPPELLDRHLWLNVHPSLLPRWRGAAPVERTIMAGDVEMGVTIIKLVERLDAGPIAAQRAFPIDEDDDAGAVYAKAAPIAVELLGPLLESGIAFLLEQPDEGATYADKITAADRDLDLSGPPEELVRRVRALSPHVGARAKLHRRPVTIWKADVEDGRFVPVEVQPDGGRRMTYSDFLRGLR